MKRLTLTIVVALVLPPALVGCGGDEQAADTGAAAGQTLDVTATDFEFDPADLHADAGELTFALTNDGGAPHALAVRGNGVDESSDVIDGGDSTELTTSLEDGTYEIYCPVGDHEEQGMVGTLTVGSSGGGSTTHEDDSTTHETETDDGTETGETDTGDTGTDDSGSDDATNY